ncbi:hypothetical protein H6P81_009492 [Aristolochia fimbriata]|uniref:Uncharacterized protein n=1 Tax=Aristolochia fimbriata TaxID=158543 RepID=A0AAV7EL12_ARIFI|nr:hypothetical protein H6P81_009492 [Aristolochia fimbriata]
MFFLFLYSDLRLYYGLSGSRFGFWPLGRSRVRELRVTRGTCQNRGKIGWPKWLLRGPTAGKFSSASDGRDAPSHTGTSPGTGRDSRLVTHYWWTGCYEKNEYKETKGWVSGYRIGIQVRDGNGYGLAGNPPRPDPLKVGSGLSFYPAGRVRVLGAEPVTAGRVGYPPGGRVFAGSGWVFLTAGGTVLEIKPAGRVFAGTGFPGFLRGGDGFPKTRPAPPRCHP